jgi:putative ABC transport system permease protein
VPHFPRDATQRLHALGGVQTVGLKWSVGDMPIAVLPGGITRVTTGSILGVTAEYWKYVKPSLQKGSSVFDDDRGTSRVAVVGRALATAIRLGPLSAEPAIYLGNVAFKVIGIVDDTVRDADPLASVSIPYATARRLWQGVGDQEVMYVRTKVGSASVVARQTALALDAYHPQRYEYDPIPKPSSVKSDVQSDLQVLLLALASISLLVGAISIANVSLMGLVERSPEIGLRRALGARRRHIVVQIVLESAIVGAIGGAIGGLVGVAAVLAIALSRDWTPVLQPGLGVVAPIVGTVVGTIAGLYPSFRASRIEPAEALRL